MSKAVVCHLTSAHPAGDVRIYEKECRSLADAGYEVVIVAPAERQQELEGVRLIRTRRCRSRWERFTVGMLETYRAARAIRCAMYHFHDPDLIPVGLLLQRSGTPVIYDAHENVPLTLLSRSYLPCASRQTVSRLFARLERSASRRFAGVIGATPSITERFARVNDRAVTISNFPRLCEVEAPERTATSWASRERAVGYVGNVSVPHGIVEMVTALARSGVEGVRLKLAGRFESESLRRDVESLDGWRRVDAFGQVGRSQINAILATVRAGLLLLRPEPNYLASQPTKLYEYMAAGIPVIASNFGLWRDIVEREACGVLVEPRRPDAVAAAIDHLVTQDAEAEQMGVRGRAAVEKAYNWETEEQKLCAFYSTILDGRRVSSTDTRSS